MIRIFFLRFQIQINGKKTPGRIRADKKANIDAVPDIARSNTV